MASTSPPECRITLAQSLSKRSAKSRCSMLMNSWRRRSASLAARPNAISTSGLTLIGTLSLRLGCHFERHHVFLGILANLQGFRLGNISRENARHAEAFMMNAEHDVRGLGDGKLEELHQNVNDEIFGCVIIVMEDHHVAGRLLKPRDRC